MSRRRSRMSRATRSRDVTLNVLSGLTGVITAAAFIGTGLVTGLAAEYTAQKAQAKAHSHALAEAQHARAVVASRHARAVVAARVPKKKMSVAPAPAPAPAAPAPAPAPAAPAPAPAPAVAPAPSAAS
jgi:hypothetical protein